MDINYFSDRNMILASQGTKCRIQVGYQGSVGGHIAWITDLFAPKIHAQRIEGLLAHYDFADDTSLAYFRKRLSEAPDDVAFGLDYVLSHADTRERQDAAAAALIFKTDVLWAQLDALWHGYVQGNIPPGAWQPGEGMA